MDVREEEEEALNPSSQEEWLSQISSTSNELFDSLISQTDTANKVRTILSPIIINYSYM